ncbi:hypothetical protein F3Y22_tig00110333pilonHSYRG00003 [Hibiscus syriacus]|uniref:Uncharacterized protein n=1 Tax=Hibiscus syriacus TaxID=106335 RepID=A0A6A3AVA0_HIBSY|nr:hypothetical protein F3Y22_tig00110333pilonHSYRG00003 [Hibiscus syriacus]
MIVPIEGPIGAISRASCQSKKAQGTSGPHAITGLCWSYAWYFSSLFMLSRLLGCNLGNASADGRIAFGSDSNDFKLCRMVEAE